MDTGRSDLNSMVKVATIPVDEPTFILRGQDACAGDAVRAWASLAAMAGVPPATVEAALRQADRMDAWPAKKLAGDDHLTDDARKQLEHQHKRRLWSSGDGVPWRLAETRDFLPEAPDALLRQLAAEQQVLAGRFAGEAQMWFEALHTAPDDATAAWRRDRARAAEDAANRGAYFLTVASALRLGAQAIAAQQAPAETAEAG